MNQSRRIAEPTLAEPTPVEPTLAAPTQSPAPRSRRTYFTPPNSGSLFPSGYGIHIAASQRFLDELIRVESQDAGPVQDCILGARVVGSQHTETSVHVRLVPSQSVAQLELLLTGTTRNSTENRTPQAVIQSEGNHQFEVSKSVQFDGQRILTRSPSAMLYPHQTNKAALTPASAIPILGPLVSEYALSVAERSRPAAEQIAAERITQQVVPQFNDAIDKRLAVLNTQLTEEIPRHLPLFGISQPTMRVRTTNKELTASFAWSSTSDTPEYTPAALPADVAELRFAIHSGAVNTWLESLPLGGMEVPIQDLDRWQQELEKALASKTSGRSEMSLVSHDPHAGRVRTRTVAKDPVVREPIIPGLGEPTILGPILAPAPQKVDKVPALSEPELALPPAEDREPLPAASSSPSGVVMILARENPIHVEFLEGEAVVTLVASFRIAPAPPTANHRIRIPLTSQLQSDGLVVTAGQVQVTTMAANAGPLSEIMRATIEKQIQQRLSPTRWPIERQIERESGQPVRLMLQEISSHTGWLSLVWNLETTGGTDIPIK